MITETLERIKALHDRPSFTPGGLYLVGSSDAARGLQALRDRPTHADELLVEVADAFELRHDGRRREEGEAELRIALERVADVARAWIAAIDRRAG